MHIIGTIIIGLLAGIVAKLLMPGRDPGGFIVTTLLGIAGAFVATYLGQAVGWYRADEGAGFIGAVVGSIIILLIYRLIVGTGSLCCPRLRHVWNPGHLVGVRRIGIPGAGQDLLVSKVVQLRFFLDKIRVRRAELERQRRDIAETLQELADVEARCLDQMKRLERRGRKT